MRLRLAERAWIASLMSAPPTLRSGAHAVQLALQHGGELDDEFDAFAIERRYGDRGLDVLHHLGEDSRYIFQRHGHKLACQKRGESGAVSWMVAEVRELARVHGGERDWSAIEAAVSSELTAPNARKSDTYEKLLDDLSHGRSAEVKAAADEVCAAFADIKNAALRQQYEEELAQLGEKCSDATAAHRQRQRTHVWSAHSKLRHALEQTLGEMRTGKDAESAHAARREITTRFKHLTPWPLRHYIFAVNLERYADPIGLSWDEACAKYGEDYTKIIQGAGRPNADVNKLLAGFRRWLLVQEEEYILSAQKHMRPMMEPQGRDEGWGARSADDEWDGKIVLRIDLMSINVMIATLVVVCLAILNAWFLHHLIYGCGSATSIMDENYVPPTTKLQEKLNYGLRRYYRRFSDVGKGPTAEWDGVPFVDG